MSRSEDHAVHRVFTYKWIDGEYKCVDSTDDPDYDPLSTAGTIGSMVQKTSKDTNPEVTIQS